MNSFTIVQDLPPSSHAFPVDNFPEADNLARRLREAIEGEVRFDRGSRALYATDASNYRHFPIGVVLPKSKEDVIRTVAICREFGAPVLSRGGGTSLSGECCNVAVVLDFTKYMHNLLELNVEEKYARVQPGMVLDDLRHKANQHGLTFGPDPATHNHCTLGGMLGNNSCGTHAQMAGKTSENTLELEVLLYDGTTLIVGPTSDEELEQIIREGGRRGEIYSRLRDLRNRYGDLVRSRYPDIPRRVSGYNLDQLLPEKGFDLARALVGSEGTCVIVLEAKLRLVPNPEKRSLVVLGYPDVYHAGDHVPTILQSHPIALEAVDQKLVDHMRKKKLHVEDIGVLPEGKGWLLVEFGADSQEEADKKAHDLEASLNSNADHPHIKVISSPPAQKKLWELRESGLGATAFVPDEPLAWPGWEDAAVAPDQVGRYLREFRALMDEFGYDAALYGHFGQGCIHCRISFDLFTAEGIRKFRQFLDRAADLVVKYNGSLSGEHGDGQARGALLPKMFGNELIEAFREFKRIWDPDWKMNPGKVIDAHQPHENLRFGADFHPIEPKTHFKLPNDSGSFARATMRCVGVGKCRREEGGTMCPSYMVTREEMHSTRGRAHALFEMLQGEMLQDGWRDKHVKEALDLCLSCKGCKGECPVNVDMATYKAEFMSHYYEGRLRPLSAYGFGFIDRWASFASLAPELVNSLVQAPVLNPLIKRVAGIPQQRKIPEFAPYTFVSWFHKTHPSKEPDGRPQVVLWPDTFNNYFHPITGQSATRVLESAGFQVLVPTQHVCCGRPLYDFGLLEEAKRYMQRNMRVIEKAVNAGLPMVVLEPSCASVFLNEMQEMMPHDEIAKRIHRQTHTLDEFLDVYAKDYRPPQWKKRIILHGHCHHKSVLKFDHEKNLLKKMEADVAVLDSGCCGMAGPFGFEEHKYEVSQALANRVLVPAVLAADRQDVILTDGFSCREAVSQNTDRTALHFAEVLHLASKQQILGDRRPEDLPIEQLQQAKRQARMRLKLVAGTAAALVAGFLLARKAGSRKQRRSEEADQAIITHAA